MTITVVVGLFFVAKTNSNALTAQAKHMMRFLRADRDGETAADIARSEGVSVKVVERSIKQIRLRKNLNTQETLNTEVVGMLMGNLGLVDKSFKKLFNAKKYIERRLADGEAELVPVDDSETKLEALKVFGEYVKAMQPKSNGLSVNVNQTNQTAHVTNIRSGGFEERLATIRKRVAEHNLLPPVTVDAREEDPDEEDEDEMEDAEVIEP